MECIEAAVALGTVWLRKQGLAALVWRAWHETDRLPAAAAHDLQAAYYSAVADTELHRAEIVTVLPALAAQGITPIAFKGAALAYTVYPDPACRPMGDIDLWIKHAEMSRAQAALEQLGYVASFKPTRPRALMILDRNELPMFGTRWGTGLVELHWGVFPGEWLQRTARIDEAAVWARAKPANLAGQSALVLTSEDNLIQVVMHLAINHNLSGPWLRGMADIVLLARAQPVDWAVVTQRARAWRLATAMWLVLKLAVELAGMEEAAAIVQELSPSTLRRWLINRFAPAESLVVMRDMSTSKWRFVYLLLLVDRPRDALRLLWRALWPEQVWLMARYNGSGLGIRLRHAWNAARGRI